jgi:hypothetical protein
MPGHSVAWRDWQRREDYYPEGVLLWLDVDAHLRELSQNKVSINQFAQRFFATHDTVERISTYSFQDVCDTLNKLAPTDWKTFLNQHLFTHARSDDIAGLHFHSYCDVPSRSLNQAAALSGVISGSLSEMAWSSASLLRALVERRSCLSFAQAFSMGFRSGE